VGAFIYPGRVL